MKLIDIDEKKFHKLMLSEDKNELYNFALKTQSYANHIIIHNDNEIFKENTKYDDEQDLSAKNVNYSLVPNLPELWKDIKNYIILSIKPEYENDLSEIETLQTFLNDLEIYSLI